MKNKSMKKKIILLLGILVIILGFVFLGQGPADNPTSLTLAPVVLVLGYLVIVPIGIFYGSKSDEKKGD